MATTPQSGQALSPWWKIGVFCTIFVGFSILIFIAVRAYRDAPPIPRQVVNDRGGTVFTRDDILAGQQVFLKYALMENGTVWGRGAYLGPDFSAAYLHTLALDAAQTEAQQTYGRPLEAPGNQKRDAVEAAKQRLLQENRYNPGPRWPIAPAVTAPAPAISLMIPWPGRRLPLPPTCGAP
jgi:nitric oxide reductase subunit B